MSSHAPKTLEVKIRPYPTQAQERPDLKHSSRVYACTDTLLDLQIRPGETCYLWKTSDGEHTRREAVIWNAAEKLSRKVVQVSKALQEACGFRLSDDVCISRCSELAILREVRIKDVAASEGMASELGDEDRAGWHWLLRGYCDRAEIIFPGMTFKDVLGDVLGRREKRTFTVITVNGSKTGIARYDVMVENPSLKIPTATELSNTEASALQVEHRPLQLVDIAGIDKALGELNKFLSRFTRQFRFTETSRSPAVLLHGGPGTGKTFVLDKIVNTGWGKVRKIQSTAKPADVQKIFKDSKISQPSIIVIDDLETLVSKNGEKIPEMTNSICQGLKELVKDQPPNSLHRVLVVAATTDLGNLPSSLRKKGGFTTTIMLPVPDAAARKSILRSLGSHISPEILDDLGERTHAYTPEDLALLLDEVYMTAEDRLDSLNIPQEESTVTQDDIEHALLVVRPSAMHDITLQPPKIRWDDIGGQVEVKEAIQHAIERPFRYPQLMQEQGVSATKGLLLYGPPGCSKTLIAQAVATEMAFNFFAVKGAEVLSKYVGDSERAVRNIFARARAAAPSIIFFDEIESIGGKRDSKNTNNGVNVLTTLLNEMDGIESLKGVTVLAATNKPQDLDLALLRPGRFDKLIYVAPPDLAGRKEILRVRQRKSKMAEDVDTSELASLTEGYSGAEVVSICNHAVSVAFNRCVETGQRDPANMEDFLKAIESVKKQITPEVICEYETWAASMR